ncbi:MAG: TerB family tellurite resistance protein [Deltaproteobacteria bacterium]|nr:TerB family tellurite resistance protein [Deltaproteobacteria bacterium]
MNNIFHAARRSLAEKVKRHRNKPFLEAMMAATALLALADEEIVLSERLALDFILENVKELKVFDVHQAVNLFRDYGKDIQLDAGRAKEKVLETVAKFSGDQQKAALLVRASILMAKADGDFNEPEQKVVDELCRVLCLESSKVCKFEEIVEGE